MINNKGEEEKWRPITGYEGIYEVSNHGRVRSLDRTVECDYHDRWGNRVTEKFMPGQVLSKRRQTTGYIQYELHDGSGLKETELYLAHRLVMSAFGPEPPSEAHEFVNHIDGDISNNHISNLEWVTPFENGLHSRIRGYIERVGPKSATEQILLWLRALRNTSSS